jgi:hypothetical protein
MEAIVLAGKASCAALRRVRRSARLQAPPTHRRQWPGSPFYSRTSGRVTWLNCIAWWHRTFTSP